MRKSLAGRMAVLAVGWILLGSAASASDYCIDVDSQYYLTLRGFRAPAPGKCRSIAGFFQASPGQSVLAILGGSACATAQSEKLLFDVVGTERGGNKGQLHFLVELARSDETGTATANFVVSPPNNYGAPVGKLEEHAASSERCSGAVLDN